MLQTISATGCLAKGELASAGGGLLVQQHAGLSLARLGNLTRLSLARLGNLTRLSPGQGQIAIHREACIILYSSRAAGRPFLGHI